MVYHTANFTTNHGDPACFLTLQFLLLQLSSFTQFEYIVHPNTWQVSQLRLSMNADILNCYIFSGGDAAATRRK